MINKKLLLVLTIMIALVGASVSFSLLMSYNGLNTSSSPELITETTDDSEIISSTPILNRDNDKTETISSDTVDVDMGAALLEKVNEENSTDTVEENISDVAEESTDNTDDAQVEEATNDTTDAVTEDATSTTDKKNDKKKKKKKGQDGPGTPIAKFTIESQGTIVRSGPNAEHAEIGSLPIGTTGEVIEKTNDYWVKINFNGDVGYIYSGYSKIEDL